MKIGEIYENNLQQQFVILKEFSKKRTTGRGSYTMYTVKFLATGTVKDVYRENAVKGKVRDDYAISVYGVGFLGFRDKQCGFYKQGKQLWLNMMKRCYCAKDDKGYKGSVVVCPRWHNLELFLKDLPELNNFDLWLKGGKCSSTRYQLDKDVLGDGTVYSKETCMFITEKENKTLGAINARAWDKRYGGVKPANKVLDRDLAKD